MCICHLATAVLELRISRGLTLEDATTFSEIPNIISNADFSSSLDPQTKVTACGKFSHFIDLILLKVLDFDGKTAHYLSTRNFVPNIL